MRILELFSGYGTASHALKQLGVNLEIVGYSDIDKYANEIFWNNHWKAVKPLRFTNNPPRELGDVKKINPNELDDFDLLTGGFPCQSFSLSGKGLGELDVRGTLFNEIIRIAEVKKPRYMLLENVKGLLSPRHKETFKKILSELRRIGYHVHWKILDTKKNGVPQSRERVFFVCFRDHTEHFNFQYPREEDLKLSIRDILEKNVDEKYYLKEEAVNKLLLNSKPNIMEEGKAPFIAASRGRYTEDKRITQRLEPRADGLANTLTSVQKDNYVIEGKRIRSLTPKECFRLQGFLDDNIKIDGISDNQLWKLAGNGQSVNVVKKIFKNMRLDVKEVKTDEP